MVIFGVMQNRNKLYWILQLSGWGLIGLVMLFFAHAYNYKISKEVLLGKIAVVTIAGIFTTHLLRLLINYLGWLMLPIEKAIPRFILAMIATSMIYSLLVLTASDLFNLGTETRKLTFATRFAGSTVDNGLFILPWVLIYYFYHFIEKSRKQQFDTLKLESLIKELELKTIKAHINPHFIFNSLNGIRALVVENPERARKAITELSNILRSSMQTEKIESVSFEKELNIVKDYLALENMRFEDRLKIEYDIDEDTLGQLVPPMMLQTLVENAIKHGISKQLSGGVVKISSDFKSNFHELTVQNTGKLNGNRNNEGFGLSSTISRLSILYGDKAVFEIKQLTTDVVEARVQLPLVEN